MKSNLPTSVPSKMYLFRNSLRNLNRAVLCSPNITNQTTQKNIHRWVAPTLRELKRRREKIGPEAPSPRSSHLEWNYEAELYAFGRRVHENFNRDILKQALTHKSYVTMKEAQGESVSLQDNKELIDEGCNIINQYLAEEFRKIYADDIVDSLVKYLTSEDMLSHVAKHLGLTDLILSNEYPVEKSILADTFKSIIAALKHSEDLERSQKFIKDFLVVQLNGKTVFDIWEPEEPISYLNKLLEKTGIKEFEARLCNESASNTILANYQVGLYSDKKLLGIGWGENIEIAKNTAALDAIGRIYKFN